MILEQKVALRLQQRYASEIIQMLKDFDNELHGVKYSGLWLDIDTINSNHYQEMTRYLNNLIDTAKDILQEIETKNINTL